MSSIYYTESRVISLNSLDRISGGNGDMTIVMPIDEKQRDFDSVCLVSASIPKSYYLVQPGFNTFILEEDGIQVVITIDDGNYSVSSFITKVIPLLTFASSIPPLSNNFIYSAVFNYDQGKFIFTRTIDAKISNFIFVNSLYELFGFDSNSTNTLGVINKLKSDNVVDFAVEVNIFLRSDICSTQNSDILASISSAGVPNFGYIKYECPDILACSRPITKFNNSHRFFLTNDRANDDPTQQILKLNGVNMILNLLIYKKSNIEQVIKSYIKLKIA